MVVLPRGSRNFWINWAEMRLASSIGTGDTVCMEEEGMFGAMEFLWRHFRPYWLLWDNGDPRVLH